MSFAVVYRFTLRPDADPEEFRGARSELTEAIRRGRGGLGSVLHRVDERRLLAYARWPDRSAWEASRRRPSAAPQAAARMQACLTDSDEPLPLEILEDRLG